MSDNYCGQCGSEVNMSIQVSCFDDKNDPIFVRRFPAIPRKGDFIHRPEMKVYRVESVRWMMDDYKDDFRLEIDVIEVE